MKILFWNTHKNQEIDSYILEFIDENPCDIIVLAEYANSINGLCNQLSFIAMDFYSWISPACETIKIISKKCYQNTVMQDEKRYSIYSLNAVYGDFILAALHLPCKLYFEPSDTEFYARRIRNDIEKIEEKLGHHRTFIVGDFNVNPFENACIQADCFHALPNGDEAKKGFRTVSGERFTTFYNPMWNLFGDFESVSGSYFYNKSQTRMYQWNIYDQVILRPELIDCFAKESLRIVENIKGRSILNRKGKPDKKISDHLPIYFEIKEDQL